MVIRRLQILILALAFNDDCGKKVSTNTSTFIIKFLGLPLFMGNMSGCLHAHFNYFVCNTKSWYSSFEIFTQFILIKLFAWDENFCNISAKQIEFIRIQIFNAK